MQRVHRSVRYLLGRGDELYAAAQVFPRDHRRAGQRRAADTHRNGLGRASELCDWLVKQRWLRANPFADVEPVGRQVMGADKPRLTVDQSRKLEAWCLARPADPDAVLTLGYLLLGPRASELVGCDVAHVDDGGRLLWLRGTKSRGARRRLLVPPELGAPLLALAADRTGDAPLFAHEDGSRWTRHVAYGRVRRSCKAAVVPVLAPQALRRTQATLATEAGATGLMVARHLGHEVGEAPAVTHRAYVGRDAARAAAVERGIVVLQGGRR